MKEGRLLMQGPMMLSQGYFGVVGRQPVYITNSTRNETFGWVVQQHLGHVWVGRSMLDELSSKIIST